MSNKITPFAMTNFRDRRVFGIREDDRRRHMYIIGKTGMGKSTLLENLVYSDIQNGHGVAYVDPHGDTAEKILKWIPEDRIKDVIYFNPADREFPIAFNVLEKVPADMRDKVASGLVSVYKKLWADSWGPRLEYILRYCILALMFAPDSTLIGINRILVDDKYRKMVLAYVTDPVVKAFWDDEFSKWTEKNVAEVISPIQNKVGQFLSNAMIRNIVGQQRSSFDFRKAMDEGKIVILNLSKGRMGEDASALLGAMMITKIQLAAMSRVDIPDEEHRRDFYLYVDEFQNFATDSFATILSEARKYRLCLTIAHQYIAQLEQGGSTAVRDAVFGNVGTLITFRVGASDAEFLEKEFSPQFMAPDIINLPKFKMYLRLMIDGIATEPFSADALPPLSTKDLGNTQAVIDYTRSHYAADRLKVEEEIYAWQRAEGGVVNKESLLTGAQESSSHIQDKTVLQVYEELKAADEKKKAKEEEKAKEKSERENRPIVWRGVCDVDGAPLELAFTPDESRPVLCQTHLKDFRKGALPTPQVEKMMAKVYERKQNPKSGVGSRESVTVPTRELVTDNLQLSTNQQIKKSINQPNNRSMSGGGDFRKSKGGDSRGERRPQSGDLRRNPRPPRITPAPIYTPEDRSQKTGVSPTSRGVSHTPKEISDTQSSPLTPKAYNLKPSSPHSPNPIATLLTPEGKGRIKIVSEFTDSKQKTEVRSQESEGGENKQMSKQANEQKTEERRKENEESVVSSDVLHTSTKASNASTDAPSSPLTPNAYNLKPSSSKYINIPPGTKIEF